MQNKNSNRLFIRKFLLSGLFALVVFSPSRASAYEFSVPKVTFFTPAYDTYAGYFEAISREMVLPEVNLPEISFPKVNYPQLAFPEIKSYEGLSYEKYVALADSWSQKITFPEINFNPDSIIPTFAHGYDLYANFLRDSSNKIVASISKISLPEIKLNNVGFEANVFTSGVSDIFSRTADAISNTFSKIVAFFTPGEEETSVANLPNYTVVYQNNPTVAPAPVPSPTPSPVIVRNTILGSQGERGTQGVIGPTGPRGPQGSPGSTPDLGNYVTYTSYERQIDGLLRSLENSNESISESIATEVSTALLNVSGDSTIGGDLTVSGNITGNILGTINPAFTLGSVPFQGSSGLTEDNSNFFWDDTNNRLGIGTTAPTQIFTVEGSGAGQTLALFKKGTSGSTISSTGLVNINTLITDDSSGTNARGLTVWIEPGAGANLARSFRGIEGDAVIPAGDTGVYSNPNSVLGLLFQALYRGNAPGSAAGTTGVYAISGTQTGNGNLASAKGIYSVISASGTGTITSGYGLYVDNPISGGTLTNNYGLYIANQTTGSNNYAVYADGTTKSYFGGNVGIGTTNPGAKLSIFGTDNKIRLSYDAANYADISAYSAGEIYIQPKNGRTYFNGNGVSNQFFAYDYTATAPYPYLWLDAHTLKLNASADSGAGKVYFTDNGASYLNGGNVGIGITNPGFPLEVNGIAKATSFQTNSILSSTGSAPITFWTGQTFSGTGTNGVINIIPTITSTSGAIYGLRVAPTYNEVASTAANTDLLINRTETAVGSGAQYLIDAGTGGGTYVSKFNVKNTGQGYFAGSVGIGTTNPGTPLDITGNQILNGLNTTLVLNRTGAVDTSIQLAGSNGKAAVQLTSGALAFWTSSSNSGTNYVGADEKMRILTNGNVGIGTTNPGVPLDFSNVVGAKIGLYNGQNYGIGIQPGLMQLYVPDSAKQLSLGYGSSASFTPVLTSINGNVGIGTTAPANRLHVAGTTSADAGRFDAGIVLSFVARPASFTAALAGAGAGNVNTGDHYYYVSYLTAMGETELSTASGSHTHTGAAGSLVTTTAGDGKVNVNVTASTDYRVTGIRIYRTPAGGLWYTDVKLVATLSNTTQTYVDNTTDASRTGLDKYVAENTTNDTLKYNTTRAMLLGVSSTFLGQGAGASITIGGTNTLLGAGAGGAVTTGMSNVFVGYGAGATGAAPNNSVAVGKWSQFAASGASNVSIGLNSLRYTTTGNYNTAIGQQAGFGNTTTSYNTFLGFYAGNYETGANKLIIDSLNRTDEATSRTSALIYGVVDATPANQVLSLGGGGKVGIGTMGPLDRLHIVSAKSNASAKYGLMVEDSTALAANVGGGILFRGIYSGVLSTSSGAIDTGKDNATDGEYGFYTRFLTRENGVTALQERLRITSTGNVGIGTTGPDRKLDILDATNPQLRLTYTDGTVYSDLQTTSDGNLHLIPNGGNAGRVILDGAGSYLDTSAGTILIGASGFSPVGTTDIVFRSSGVASSVISPVFRIKDSTSALQDGIRFSPTWINSTPGTLNASVAVSSLGMTAFTINSTTTTTSTNFNGNVGIGTTNPGSKLEVSGGSVSITQLDSTVLGFNVKAYDTTASGGGGQNIFERAGGTLASPTAVTNGMSLGSLSFRGYNGSGFTGSKAYISASVTENWSTTANGTGLMFKTTPNGSTTLTDRLFIDNNGNVGIGTVSSPGARLELSVADASDILKLTRTGAGASSSIFSLGGARLTGITTQGAFVLQDVATDATNKALRFGLGHYTSAEEPFYAVFGQSTLTENSLSIGGGTTSGNAATVLAFYTAANTTTVTGTERMRIDSAGNVLIGGTAVRATTAGTNQLILFNGTAPVGTLVNGISMYSTAGEAYIMDAAGNATLQSPHENENNYWVFDSRNAYTGKTLLVDMELLIKDINDSLELDYVHETIDGETTPRSKGTILSKIFSKITLWMADAGNGIGEVWGGTFKAKDKLCINETCVTEDELKALIQNAGTPTSSTTSAPTIPEPAPSTPSEPAPTTPVEETPVADTPTTIEPEVTPAEEAPVVAEPAPAPAESPAPEPAL